MFEVSDVSNHYQVWFYPCYCSSLVWWFVGDMSFFEEKNTRHFLVWTNVLVLICDIPLECYLES